MASIENVACSRYLHADESAITLTPCAWRAWMTEGLPITQARSTMTQGRSTGSSSGNRPGGPRARSTPVQLRLSRRGTKP